MKLYNTYVFIYIYIHTYTFIIGKTNDKGKMVQSEMALQPDYIGF